MSILWSCQGLGKSYPSGVLFNNIALSIEDGTRTGLMGPNGAGKSTLLKIMAGIEAPDTGAIAPRRGMKVVYLPQIPVMSGAETVNDEVVEFLRERGVSEVERHTRAQILLSRFGFLRPDIPVRGLSGGLLKRLALVRVLACEPDLLLLDEPTNHLDIEGILILEDLLSEGSFAAVVASHDRYFLQNTTRHTVELSRVYSGGLLSVPGNYGAFLERKSQYLAEQEQREEVLANKMRRELEWLHRGAKARTTKQSARIQNAETLKQEFLAVQERNAAERTSRVEFDGTGRKTKKLMEVRHLAKSLGDRCLFRGLNFIVSPRLRIGLLGLNGSGKTTLLKTLAGEIAPDEGTIKNADGLRVVYFDQLRERLDPADSLRRVLAPHSDSVVYRDRLLHVVSYAKHFLFRPEQLDVPVGKLSGGEQARLLIARLMLQPADVLLLDEPTNDLDLGTLEALEDNLLDFPGAIVLVTHDRYLLDRVSTVIMALDGKGGVTHYADFDQWRKNEKNRASAKNSLDNARSAGQQKPLSSESRTRQKKRLSYLEQREWDAMEQRIAEAEAEVARCSEAVHDPAIAANATQLAEAYALLKVKEKDVETLYARWAELEAKVR